MQARHFKTTRPLNPPSPQHSACAVFGHNRLLLRLWTCVLYWETLDFGFTSSHLCASVNTAAVLWCWPGLIMICSTPQASHPFRLRGWQALSIFGCISSRPHAYFLQRFRLTHGALLSVLILGVGGTHLSHWKSFFLAIRTCTQMALWVFSTCLQFNWGKSRSWWTVLILLMFICQTWNMKRGNFLGEIYKKVFCPCLGHSMKANQILQPDPIKISWCVYQIIHWWNFQKRAL